MSNENKKRSRRQPLLFATSILIIVFAVITIARSAISIASSGRGVTGAVLELVATYAGQQFADLGGFILIAAAVIAIVSSTFEIIAAIIGIRASNRAGTHPAVITFAVFGLIAGGFKLVIPIIMGASMMNMATAVAGMILPLCYLIGGILAAKNPGEKQQSQQPPQQMPPQPMR